MGAVYTCREITKCKGSKTRISWSSSRNTKNSTDGWREERRQGQDKVRAHRTSKIKLRVWILIKCSEKPWYLEQNTQEHMFTLKSAFKCRVEYRLQLNTYIQYILTSKQRRLWRVCHYFKNIGKKSIIFYVCTVPSLAKTRLEPILPMQGNQCWQ